MQLPKAVEEENGLECCQFDVWLTTCQWQ